jgi:hypothetical protein
MLSSLWLIIEVKSQYLLDRDYDTIYLKAKACVNAGWEFVLVVSSNGKDFQFIPFRYLQGDYNETKR